MVILVNNFHVSSLILRKKRWYWGLCAAYFLIGESQRLAQNTNNKMSMTDETFNIFLGVVTRKNDFY